VKTPIRILACLVAGAALSALAADPPKDEPKKLTPQQQKMSDCAKQSKGMKGDEHKKFMSDCLKGNGAKGEPKPVGMPAPEKKPAPEAKPPMSEPKPMAEPKKPMAEPKKPTQQDKMKSCNAMAGDKKGDDRKKFISDCLKGAA
jgi:hypothetical protein